MFKWIKNSKGAVNNNSTKYKGITVSKDSKYKANITLRISTGKGKPKKLVNVYLGQYNSIKEAKKARIKYILSLL